MDSKKIPNFAENDELQGEHLIHYSQHDEPLEMLDPTKHGSGRAGHELRRGKVIPRTYYYEAGSDPETLISDTAKYRYVVPRPQRIMDLASDEARPFLERVRDMNELEELLHSSGYHGYKNSAHPQLANAVAVFHPQKPLSHKSVKRYADGGDVSMAPEMPEPEVEPSRAPASEPPVVAPEQPAEGQSLNEPSMTEITKEYAPMWDLGSSTPRKTQLSHEQVQDAVSSGEFSFAKGAKVPIFDPQGNFGYLPASEFDATAIQDGFRYATPHAIQQQKYGGAGQQLITGVEGAAQGLLGPLAPYLEVQSGLATKEDILAREEANPSAFRTGEFIGFGVPLVATLGEFGAARAGLSGAAKILNAGKVASESAFTLPGVVGRIGEAVVPIAQESKFFTRVPLKAVRGALEGTLFAASDQATQAYLGNPEQNANTFTNALIAGAGSMALFSAGLSVLGFGARGAAKYLLKGVESEAPALPTSEFKITPEEIEKAGGKPARPVTEVPEGAPQPPEGTFKTPEMTPEEAATLSEAPEAQKGLYSEEGFWVTPEDIEKYEAGDVATMLKYHPDIQEKLVPPSVPRGKIAGYMTNFFKKIGLSAKEDSKEIIEAIKRITDGEIREEDIPLVLLTDNKIVHLATDNLVNIPAINNTKLPSIFNTIFTKSDAKLKQLLGENLNKSEAELGKMYQEAISKAERAKKAEFKEPYQFIDNIFDSLPFGAAEKETLVQRLEAQKKQGTYNEQYNSTLDKVIGELQTGKYDTMAEFRQLIQDTAKNADFEQPTQFVKGNLKAEQGYNKAWSIFKDYENMVGKNLPNNPLVAGVDRARILEAWPEKLKNDKEYSEFVNKLKFLAEQVGINKKYVYEASPEQLISSIEKISPDVLYKNLSLKGMNYNELTRFEKDFQDLTRLLRTGEKQRLFDRISKVSHTREKTTILKEINNYKKEQKALLFNNDEEQQLMKDLLLMSKHNDYHRNYSNTNLSGVMTEAAKTGFILAKGQHAAAMGLQGLLKGARRAIKSTEYYSGKKISPESLNKPPKKYAEGGMVTALPESDIYKPHTMDFAQAVQQPAPIKQAQNMAHEAIKGVKLMNNSVKSLFDPHSNFSVPAPSEKRIKELKSMVQKVNVDPTFLMNETNPAFPNISGAAAQTVSRMATYLNTVEPKQPKTTGIESALPPAPTVHQDKYNHVLKVVEQPLFILNKVKNNTIIPEEIQAMKTIYPQLYDSLSEQITKEMIDHKTKNKTIPYRTKLGIAMFLGQPLDSTMTPQSIQAVQAMSKGSQQGQQGQGPATPQKGPHNLNPLDKLANMAKTPDQNRLQERSLK